MKPVIEAKNLSKAYKAPQKLQILTDVNLTVHEGASLAIMGRSGAGKTTLLHALGTLETIDSGSLKILGRDVNETNKDKVRAADLGFIFQSYNLLEDFSAIENVLMPARILRQKASKESTAYKRAQELLEQVGLEERADFPAKLLSGGERQRVAIARALCNDPKIILADEPSGNLDAENASLIYSLLLEIVRKQKKTLIVVTHDEELAKLCDQTYILTSGKLFP
jgi:lipoprotein-releasing system ATP-binding protein